MNTVARLGVKVQCKDITHLVLQALEFHALRQDLVSIGTPASILQRAILISALKFCYRRHIQQHSLHLLYNG